MRLLRQARVLLLALVAAAALAVPASALTFPALTGRVVDEANILDASDRAALTARLADLEARTTDQLVVVTLRSLQGLTIEDYGVRLGRAWKIGQKDKNNGVLLIVAPTDRKVRIEVGYGLEGELTDAVSRLIMDKSILPRFRDSDFRGGISRGVHDIADVLGGNAAEWKKRATRQYSWLSRVGRVVFGVLSWIPEDFILIGLVFLLGAVVSLLTLVWLRILLPALIYVGIATGLVSKKRWRWLARRQAKWHFLSVLDSTGSGSSGSTGSSWASVGSSGSSGGGFSGGGGSFGGGGASGSW